MRSKNRRIRTLGTLFQGSVKARIHSRETLSIHRRIEANSLGGLEAILDALPKRLPTGSLRLSSATRSTFCGPEFRYRIDDLGSATQILDVDHEFFRGTNQTLRILVNLK